MSANKPTNTSYKHSSHKKLNPKKLPPKKLHNSKWTALKPLKKEKHFLVTEVEFDEEGAVIHCLIEAVISNRSYAIDWTDLKNETKWRQGWN
ncbi:TIGR02450 family Trp-rich protein [Agaribacterium sp. ZY112]|uniref:TIGR02450 family Trp-rich protein n=1 Tax=Agaribacterium sp. ZY112 TaxID=3233574 RepID=UPI003523EB93